MSQEAYQQWVRTSGRTDIDYRRWLRTPALRGGAEAIAAQRAANVALVAKAAEARAAVGYLAVAPEHQPFKTWEPVTKLPKGLPEEVSKTAFLAPLLPHIATIAGQILPAALQALQPGQPTGVSPLGKAARAAQRGLGLRGIGAALERRPRRKYKITKGRRMKWDSKYKGYVPVRRGRRMTKQNKFKMIALMTAGGNVTPMQALALLEAL